MDRLTDPGSAPSTPRPLPSATIIPGGVGDRAAGPRIKDDASPLARRSLSEGRSDPVAGRSSGLSLAPDAVGNRRQVGEWNGPAGLIPVRRRGEVVGPAVGVAVLDRHANRA